MALLPQCPLKKPISFVKQKNSPEVKSVQQEYHEAQQEFWDNVAANRLRTIEARRKFTELSSVDISQKWAKFDESAIDRLRLQFRMIDVDEDGLIEFEELCGALDEIGDQSSIEERRRYFDEFDVDHSDGIDFEEFLGLIDKAQCSDQGGVSSAIEKMCDNAASDDIGTVLKIKQLPVRLLLKHKLF